eukprot:7561429-Pyramimonas_sp.AAC.1
MFCSEVQGQGRKRGPRGAMWGPFWAAFEGCDILVHKALARATSKDVEAGRASAWEKKANASADQYAKLGAKMPGADDSHAEPFLGDARPLWLSRGGGRAGW